MTTVITGDRGAGKTTFLLKLIDKLKETYSVGGIITPAEYDNHTGIKTGFDALDLSADISWPLGRIGEDLGGPSVGPFSFSSEGLEKAISAFRRAAEESPDYIFLDEIGPLEIEKRAGFFPLVPIFQKLPESIHLFVVVRPSLVDRIIREYFPDKPVRVIPVTPSNRNTSTLIQKAMEK